MPGVVEPENGFVDGSWVGRGDFDGWWGEGFEACEEGCDLGVEACGALHEDRNLGWGDGKGVLFEGAEGVAAMDYVW